MRQLFGDVTKGRWRQDQHFKLSDPFPMTLNRVLRGYTLDKSGKESMTPRIDTCIIVFAIFVYWSDWSLDQPLQGVVHSYNFQNGNSYTIDKCIFILKRLHDDWHIFARYRHSVWIVMTLVTRECDSTTLNIYFTKSDNTHRPQTHTHNTHIYICWADSRFAPS